MQRPSPNRPFLLGAMLAALAVAVGYVFLLIPNVEFITATIFISGCLTGRLQGLCIGLVAEFLFSFFNPMGAPAPPLLAAQMFAMGLTGFCGGMLKNQHWQERSLLEAAFLFGITGLALTFIYDLLTNLSIGWMIAGAEWSKMRPILAAGLGFSIIHWVGNTAGFAIAVPLLLRRLIRLNLRA